MTFLNKYIRRYWLPFSVAVLFLTFEAIFDLLQPTIMAKIIDVGVANRDLDYVVKMGGLMLLITALGAISAATRNIVSSIVSQSFGTELRSDLFRKIQSLSFQNIDRFDRASLVTRLTNDVTQLQVFVNGLMRIFVKAPLLCIGGLIMATRLNAQLALILAVIVPLVAVLIIINMKLGFPFFVKVQQAIDRVNGAMREYLSGVRVVKAFNRFDFEIRKFNRANSELQVASTSATRVMSVFSPIMILTMNLGIVAVLWFGGYGVQDGKMQVGEIIAFTNYMTQILFSLKMISMIFNMFVRARASAGRINEVFAEEDLMIAHDGVADNYSLLGSTQFNDRSLINSGHHSYFDQQSQQESIQFQAVSFSYEGASEPVLKDISFSCLRGETIGIIGSTGSGKSSLLALIPRFYDVSEGAVKVNGKDVRRIDLKSLREKIAVVPQKTTLFTGTIFENIQWGKENATVEEIERAASIAEAHDFIIASPEGYQTRIGQGGVNLSGGQKQRISIARALVREPEILLLDDSTSAVDVATEARIKEALKKYTINLTCIIIAQRITSVIDADKIIVLDHGRMVGFGSHHELMVNCSVYQEIYQSQMGMEVQ